MFVTNLLYVSKQSGLSSSQTSSSKMGLSAKSINRKSNSLSESCNKLNWKLYICELSHKIVLLEAPRLWPRRIETCSRLIIDNHSLFFLNVVFFWFLFVRLNKEVHSDMQCYKILTTRCLLVLFNFKIACLETCFIVCSLYC